LDNNWNNGCAFNNNSCFSKKEKMDLEPLLDIFYPKFCLSCKKEKVYLCADCFSKIEIFQSPYCPYCGLRSFNGLICKNHKKALKGFVSATPYNQEIVKKLIDNLKYSFVKEIAKTLALLMFKFLKENPEIEFFKNPDGFILIPVPLHKRRLCWRGFNQSEEIAKELSPLIKIPIKNDLLFKIKPTKPQVGLQKEARIKNIENSFLVNKNKLKLILNKKIILIDDVATTLSTLEEAAKTLKKAGAKEVWGIAIAHG